MSIVHQAILRCPVKDVSTPKGWQTFLKWFALNNLNWASSPVVIPSAARLEDTGGTQYVLAHGILTGTADDGDTVTFARAFSGTPVIVFGDGGLSYDSTIGAATSQQRKLTALNLTSTGFTMSAKIASAATGLTARSDVFVPITATTTASATKALAQEAYDDGYVCNYDVTIAQNTGSPDFEDTVVQVIIEAKPSGGAFVTYSTQTLSNSEAFAVTTSFNTTITVDGLGLSAVIRITITRISGSLGSTITCSDVDYTEAAAITENSATPAGVSSISWIAMGGT